MLNRVFNLARRQKPQAFPPRKRAMASTCYGRQEHPELDTFVEPPDHIGESSPEGGDVPVSSGAGTEARPHPRTPGGEASLAIGQMRGSIEDGLVMVFGPDGDPVPPHAFAAAVAEQPDARIALADGKSVLAQRLAMVLQAQTLGRLGAAEHGDGWIMAMLEGPGPEMASDDDLKAEQDQGMPEERALRMAITTPTGDFMVADAQTGPVGEVFGLFLQDGTPISAGALIERLRERRNADEVIDAAVAAEPAANSIGDGASATVEDALDLSGCSVAADAEGVWLESPALAAIGGRLHLVRWATSAPNGPAVSLSRNGIAASLEEVCAALDMAPGEEPEVAASEPPGSRSSSLDPSEDGRLVADLSEPITASGVRAGAAIDALASAGAADEIDPERIVLVVVRGVPEGATLSAGIRDDDGSWSLSPLDLSSVTITLPDGAASHGEDAVDADLTMTGIALMEDDGLATVIETVPLGDYLAGAAAADEEAVAPGSVDAPRPAADRSGDQRAGAIALPIDRGIWDGEEFDALVIRDLPAGASMSAGNYDPTIDGWVLMPQDLSELTIVPPPDQATDFTLTLMGIVLRPGDSNAARVLTRLPVAIR